MCAGASTSVSSGLSVNSSNHSGISRKRSSDSPLPSSFYFGFGFLEGDPHHFPGAGPSLRYRAGLVEDKSCNVNVEDELLPEWADNPGTTSGTKLSVLHIIVFLCGQPWFLTADPLMVISVVFAEFSKR